MTKKAEAEEEKLKEEVAKKAEADAAKKAGRRC